MSRSRACTLLGLAFNLLVAATAQVVAPVEIKNPELRSLQFKYMDDLKAVGAEIENSSFPFPFYLSRKLDLDEQQQKSADQRSIRFDEYNGRTVLAVTGNYYAAYGADQINQDQRARATFLAVIAPLLKIAVPPFQTNPSVQGFAFEVSHHIKGKVMGVEVERPENVMAFFPRNAALKYLAAKDDAGRPPCWRDSSLSMRSRSRSGWKARVRNPASSRLHPKGPMRAILRLPSTPSFPTLRKGPTPSTRSFRCSPSAPSPWMTCPTRTRRATLRRKPWLLCSRRTCKP